MSTIKYYDKEKKEVKNAGAALDFVEKTGLTSIVQIPKLIKKTQRHAKIVLEYLLGLEALKLGPKMKRPDFLEKIGYAAEHLSRVTQIQVTNKGITYWLNCESTLKDISLNTNLINQVFLGEGYCTPEEIKGKIVVDAGANIGTFSIWAAKNGAKKIYSFEPVKSTVKMLKSNVACNKIQNKVKIIPLGLGDKVKEVQIKLVEEGHPSASITLERKSNKTEKIKLTTIDNYFKSKKIDFLKIDVEGYEKEVLIGGKNVIARNLPLIVFSAYHKPDDKVVLPKTIAKISNKYKTTLFTKGMEEKFRSEVV
ncbi:MAG: FkbM family methyltransferase [archaeon]|jgi:FkbM family methyltransferase